MSEAGQRQAAALELKGPPHAGVEVLDEVDAGSRTVDAFGFRERSSGVRFAADRELVIVNRLALRSRAGFISRLRTRLAEAVFAEPEAGRRQLERAPLHGFNRVTVSGGDGTLNSLLEPILAAGVPVRLVPSGTANDLAHELGIATGVPSQEIDAARFTVREMDVLDASGHAFTTVGYLGFGSEVVRAVNGWRKHGWSRPLQILLGKFIYVLGVAWIGFLKALPLYKLRIESHGRVFEVITPLVVAANQPRVGGTMTLAPGTRNDDGTFRLLVFRQTGGLALLRAIAALCSGAEPAGVGVESFEASRVDIELTGSRPFLFCADGEELVESDRLTLSVHPRKLKVLVAR